MKTVFPGAISIFLFIGAVALFWIGAQQVFYGYSSKSWPSTKGTITYSEFEYFGSGSNRLRRPVVRYSYEVSNTNYVSERIAFGPVPSDKGGEAVFSTSRGKQIKSFAVMKEGSAVTVYYDADQPKEAVLLHGNGTFVLIYFFCGLLCGAFGFVCFLLATGRINGY